MKKTQKVVLATVIMLVATTLVSASLMTSYGNITSTLEIKSPVLIDGEPWTTPLSHSFIGYGGDTFVFTHTLTNDGPRELLFEWEHIGTPDLEGIDIDLTVNGEPLGLQFSLEPKESIDVTFTFSMYSMIQPNTYIIESYLKPGYC